MNFGETLDRVGTVLAAGSWQWAVAGGVALSAYGNPRMTLDLADIAYLLAIPGTDRVEARGYFVKAGLSDRWEQLTHVR